MQPGRAESKSPARRARRARDVGGARAKWLLGFLVAFLAITLWRWEIVDSPPYWDSAMGLFLEADFLAESGFDYRRLIFEEKRFLEGGRAVYLNSVLPTFVAILMTVFPSPRGVIIAYHLFTFACAAAIGLLVVSLLRARAGTIAAVAVAVALVTTPVFATQVDMLGMDLPLLALALVVAKFLANERYVLAALASLASFFIKSTGQAVTTAVMVYLVLLLLARWNQGGNARKRLWLGLGTTLLALAIEVQLSMTIQSLPTSEHEQWEPDLWQGVEILKSLWTWCPDVVVLFAVTLPLWVGMFAWKVARGARPAARGNDEGGGTSWDRWSVALRGEIWDKRIALFGWIVIFGMLLAFALVYTIPRYLILPLAFLYVILGVTWLFGRRWRPVATGLVALVVGFNLWNADGRFLRELGQVDPWDKRTGAILERSREYLADHRSNLELARYLEANGRDWYIVAPNPFVHFLSLPRLGYVRSPLKGYSANTFVTPEFPSVEALKDDPFRHLLYVWAQNRFMNIARGAIPFPDGRNECRTVFRDDRAGPLRIYYKVWPERMAPDDVKNAYLVDLFGGEGLLAVAKRAEEAGELEAALTVYRKAIEADPKNVDALFQAAFVAHRLRDLATSEELYGRALGVKGDHGRSLNGLGVLLAEAGRVDEAIARFQAAEEALAADAALDPAGSVEALAEARRNWGLALWRRGDLEGAARQFASAVTANPALALAHRDLGQVRLALGEVASGIEALDQAVRLMPDDGAIRVERGIAREELLGDPRGAREDYAVAIEKGAGGRDEKKEGPWLAAAYSRRGRLGMAAGDTWGALADFRKAVQLAEDSPDHANNLAWLLATGAREAESASADGAEAVRLAERACALTNNERADLIDTLAAAYAAVGEWDKAIAAAERARQLAKEKGNDTLAAAIAGRLENYRQKRPFRQAGGGSAP